MAYVALTSRVAGNPILVSDWNKNKNNWDAIVDAATSKIETDVVVADSITAGAVGASEIATDGVGQDEIAASAVGQGELKTSTEEVSQFTSFSSVWYTKTFSSVSSYPFYPQIKCSNAVAVTWHIAEAITAPTSYETRISFLTNAGGSYTTYAQCRYVQASPPYPLGEIEGEDWGMFLWIVRDKSGAPISMRRAADPCWAFEAKRLGIPKEHPACMALDPNPFARDTLIPDGKPGEMPPGASIVLLDLREFRAKVKPDRAQRELSKLQARRAEFAAQGIPLHTLDAFEADAAKRAADEIAQNLAWENELEQLDAKTEATIRRLGQPEMRTYQAWVPLESMSAYPGAEEIQRTTVRRGDKLNQVLVMIQWQEEYRRRTEHEMAAVVPSLHLKAAKRRAWITGQLFGRTKIDEICEDLEAHGKSLLQAVNDGEDCCGVDWKPIRDADATLPGGEDVPGLKECGVRVVCK